MRSALPSAGSSGSICPVRVLYKRRVISQAARASSGRCCSPFRADSAPRASTQPQPVTFSILAVQGGSRFRSVRGCPILKLLATRGALGWDITNLDLRRKQLIVGGERELRFPLRSGTAHT